MSRLQKAAHILYIQGCAIAEYLWDFVAGVAVPPDSTGGLLRHLSWEEADLRYGPRPSDGEAADPTGSQQTDSGKDERTWLALQALQQEAIASKHRLAYRAHVSDRLSE
jgi:hypothetical protein